MGEKWQQMKAAYLVFKFWARRWFVVLGVLLVVVVSVYSTVTSDSIMMFIGNLGWGLFGVTMTGTIALLAWNEPYPGSSDGPDDGDDPEDPDDDPLPGGVRPRCRYKDLGVKHPDLN